VDIPEEKRSDAEKTGVLVRMKLLQIMDLQADIYALLKGKPPSPYGSDKWQNSRPEILQRVVLMAATQFVLFEPGYLVKGNDQFKVAAEKLLEIILDQLKLLRETEPQG
jgi:hypothetical protein